MNADLIIVKQNTIARTGNIFSGPHTVTVKENFKAVIQNIFRMTLRGIAGHVLVCYNGQLWQMERDNIDPSKPYVKVKIKYHPLAKYFTSRVG